MRRRGINTTASYNTASSSLSSAAAAAAAAAAGGLATSARDASTAIRLHMKCQRKTEKRYDRPHLLMASRLPRISSEVNHVRRSIGPLLYSGKPFYDTDLRKKVN